MLKMKKLLAVLLALVMAFACFTAIPMTVSAADTVYYAKLDYASKETWSYLQTELPLEAGTYQFDVDYRIDGTVLPAVGLAEATEVSSTYENNHITVQFTCEGQMRLRLKPNSWDLKGVIYFANPVLRKVEDGAVTGENLVWDFSKQYTDVGSTITTAYGWKGKWQRVNESASATFTVAADTINLFTEEQYYAKLDYASGSTWSYLQTELPLVAGTYQFDVDYRVEGDGGVLPAVGLAEATEVSSTNENNHITFQFTCDGQMRLRLKPNSWDLKGIIYFANPVLRKVENGEATGKNYVWDFSQQSALAGSTITTDYGWNGKWQRVGDSTSATFTVAADNINLFTEQQYYAKLNYSSANTWTYLQTELPLDAGTYQIDVDYRADSSVTPAVNLKDATKISTVDKNNHLTVQFTWGGGTTQVHLKDTAFSGTGVIYFANPVLRKVENGSATGRNLVWDFSQQSALVGSDVTTTWGYRGKWYKNNNAAAVTVAADTTNLFTDEQYLAKLNYTNANSWTVLQAELPLDAGTYLFDVEYRTEGSVNPKATFAGATLDKYTKKAGHITAQVTMSSSGTFQVQLKDSTFSGKGIIYLANPTLKKIENGVANGKNFVWDFSQQAAILGSTITTDYGWKGKWQTLKGKNDTNLTTFTAEKDTAGIFETPIEVSNEYYYVLDADGDLVSDEAFGSFDEALDAVTNGGTILAEEGYFINLDNVSLNKDASYTICGEYEGIDSSISITNGILVNAGNVTFENITCNGTITVNNNASVTINGGTYTAQDNIILANGSGNITVTGGAVLDKSANNSNHCIHASATASGTITFDDATLKNAKWGRIFDVTGTQNLVITKNTKIIPNAEYGSALMKATGGTVSISGQKITIGNNTLLSAPGAEVILSNCKFTSKAAVVEFNSNTTLTVKSNSTFETTHGQYAFKNNIKGTINGEDMLTVIEPIDYTDGTSRILRLAGDKNGSWGGYAQWVNLEANSTYTYSFDYRATGGIKLWNQLSLENITKSDEVLTGTHYTVTLTTGNSPSCTIILGEKSDSTGGTLYLGNISIVKSGSTTNLVKNGDFSANDLSNWTAQNNPTACFESIDLIKPDDSFNFFDDASVEAASDDYAIALKGGSWKVYTFTAYLEANTSYSFSYDYRAIGDAIRFYVTDGVTLTENAEGTDRFTKNYTITNGAKAQKVDFKFGTEQDTTGDIMYLSNLKLYKLDSGVATGANMVADLNPVYSVYYKNVVNEGDEIEFNTADNKAYSNKVGFGWVCNDSTVNLSVVKLSDDFFTKYSGAGVLTIIRKALLDGMTSSFNPYYDANRDGKITLADLVREKKVQAELLGNDYETYALKNEIMNAENTDVSAITGKIVYVDSAAAAGGNGTEQSPYNSITTAQNNVSSGGAVLLKRGSTFRGSYTLKSGVTYGSYGEGAKPEIIGSTKDWKTATWTNVEGNIWSVSYGSYTRPGNIYLFKGNNTTTPAVIGRVIDNTSDSYFDSNDDLVKEGDMRFANKTVYLYSEGKPSDVYSRIEISAGETAVVLNNNVTVNNIAVKYAGNHGISSSNENNITISYCEIAYIGGTESEGAPLGNGIQFGLGGSNLVADHNYIYECYDAGITPQIWDSYKAGNFDGVTISNNLLTNNFYNVELWAEDGQGLKNIVITDNIMNDAGYCWSWDQRFETLGNAPFLSSHIYGSKDRLNTTSGNSISIKNNSLNNARALQVAWYWNNGSYETFPGLTVENNKYYQPKGSLNCGLMLYGNTDPTKILIGKSQATFESAIKAFDSNPATVEWIVTNK